MADRRRESSDRDAARQRAMERARERHKSVGYKSGSGSNVVTLPDGVEFYKIEAGRNILDVIPFTSTRAHILEKPTNVEQGELWYRVKYKVHRNVGPNNDSLVCPTSQGKKCPICEERMHLFDQKMKDEAKTLFPSDRNLIMVRSQKDTNKIQVLDISEFAFNPTLKSSIKAVEDDGMDGANLFYWPEAPSYKLRCEFEETSFGTGGTFMKCTRIDFKERDDLEKAILDLANEIDLQNCLNIQSYNAIRNLFLGLDVPEEDETPPATESKATAPRTRSPAVAEEKPQAPAKDILDDLNEDELLDEIERAGIKIDSKKLRKMDEDDLRAALREHASIKKSDKGGTQQQKPPARTERKPTGAKTSKKGTCPHGHDFGVDTDKQDECRECVAWPDCADTQDNG